MAKETTAKVMDNDYENILGKYYFDEKMSRITTEMLQSKLDIIVKDRSGIREIKFLKMFFKYVHERGWIYYNPAVDLYINNKIEKSKKGAERLEKAKKKKNWLEGNDYTNFIHSVKIWDVYEQDKAILLLGIWSGLRTGEIRGLKIKDIDFENKLINVDRQYKINNTYGIPKGEKTRKVPMSEELMELLIGYINREKLE